VVSPSESITAESAYNIRDLFLEATHENGAQKNFQLTAETTDK